MATSYCGVACSGYLGLSLYLPYSPAQRHKICISLFDSEDSICILPFRNVQGIVHSIGIK